MAGILSTSLLFSCRTSLGLNPGPSTRWCDILEAKEPDLGAASHLLKPSSADGFASSTFSFMVFPGLGRLSPLHQPALRLGEGALGFSPHSSQASATLAFTIRVLL